MLLCVSFSVPVSIPCLGITGIPLILPIMLNKESTIYKNYQSMKEHEHCCKKIEKFRPKIKVHMSSDLIFYKITCSSYNMVQYHGLLQAWLNPW